MASYVAYCLITHRKYRRRTRQTRTVNLWLSLRARERVHIANVVNKERRYKRQPPIGFNSQAYQYVARYMSYARLKELLVPLMLDRLVNG